MTRKIWIFSVILTFFSLSGCEDDLSNKMTDDYPQNYDITYELRQVLQYDPMHISGIDISKKLDFFKTVKFTLHYNDSKLTRLTYSNGNVPFSPFSFEGNPDVEADCELDYSVSPNELRVSGTDKVIAYYQNGEFIMPFQLDCSSISYKYTFVNVE